MKNSAGSADRRLDRSKWAGLRLMSDGRRAGPVETALGWAWREELPKAPKAPGGPEGMLSGWSKTGRFGEYLSLVELHGVNRYGCVPDFSAESTPHPDAREIAAAVFALDDLVLELPQDWAPAPELDRFEGLGAKAVASAWRRMTRTADGQTVLRVKPSDIVIQRAIMGHDLNGMALDDVTEQVERTRNGKDRWFIQAVQHTLTGRTLPNGEEETQPTLIELNGVDRNGHPKPGAYRKRYLDPDPVGIIVDRAEHEIWQSCLAFLHVELDGRLADVVIEPSQIPAAPWLEMPKAGRVLHDLVGEARMARDAREAKLMALSQRFPMWFRRMQKNRIAPA